MSQDSDHADKEVKGLSRYIPTTLSKAILIVLPGVLWLVFSSLREHPEWFLLESLTELEKTLAATTVSLLLGVLLVLLLALDMAVALHHSKHRRIVHYSNEHPYMTIKFFIQNASVGHWLFLGVLCAACIYIGYQIGQT